MNKVDLELLIDILKGTECLQDYIIDIICEYPNEYYKGEQYKYLKINDSYCCLEYSSNGKYFVIFNDEVDYKKHKDKVLHDFQHEDVIV